jgi:hypothetical protein
LDPVEITIQVPVENPLKVPERSRLLNALTECFKAKGIEEVVMKEIYFIDRRSPVVPTEGVISFVVTFSLGGAAVQIIEALESLIEDGKGSTKKLLIMLGSKSVVNPEGNLVPDEDIVKLIWAARNKTERLKEVENSPGTALVYGTIVYPIWSSEPIPIVLTLKSRDAINGVIDGRMRGLAPQIRVKWFSCSICTENIEHCEHKIGEKYNDKVCVAVPRDIVFLEETLTDAIVDSRCKVTDVLLIEKSGSEYTWYGFQGVNVLDRLKNINEANKDKIIERDAATKFRLYFSRRSAGHCRYRRRESEAKALVASHRKSAKG